jgi:formylglycine-generating enzyme required for sulfatase activity
LYLRGNGPAPGSASPQLQPATVTHLPGFRTEMWMLPADDLLGFIEIPAGAFVMGSDKATDPLAFDNERWSSSEARGTVDLATFFINRYEVTVAQFQAFAAGTGKKVDPQALAGPPDHPVAFVSWPDALAYCRWLEGRLKASTATPLLLKERLDEGWRLTLPSEAEWEKAARGADARRYPWGNSVRRERANFGGKGTVAVGSIACPDCAYGLSDMSGNVWEWTRSPYQPYPYDPADDDSTVGSDALWVMRGGGFNDGEQMARTTTRGGADPGVRRPFIGFRVALTRT